MAEINVMVLTQESKPYDTIDNPVAATVFIDDDEDSILADKSKIEFNVYLNDATEIIITHLGNEWKGTISQLAEELNLI